MLDTAELVLGLFVYGALAAAGAAYVYEFALFLIRGDDAAAFSRPGFIWLNFVARPINFPGVIAVGYLARVLVRLLP